MLKNIQYYILFSICLFLFSCDDNGNIPTYGCLDPDSENYCGYCNVDDGSCYCGVEDGEYTHTFSDILDAIGELPVDHRCTTCHSGDTPAQNFNIEDYNSVKSRVNDCANFETSLLLEKITTGSMAQYADQNLINKLEIWISEGAPE